MTTTKERKVVKMIILPESVLIESKSARDHQLAEISQERATEILNQVKALYFALWQGVRGLTIQQVAQFYEVSEESLRQLQKTYRAELESDGLKTLRGKALSDARDRLSLASKSSQVSLWTPRSVLRVGMPMRNSAVAQAVRTTLLDLVEKVIPAQAESLEKLKLENQSLAYQLELAKTQERLMLTTSAIATMHGSQMVALILGKPDAVITRIEKVETLVTVDDRGRAIAKYDGIGITYLARRFGFGSNTKACRHWLQTIGVSESQWLTEPSLVKAQKLPREILPWLDHQYAARQGTRQGLLGE